MDIKIIGYSLSGLGILGLALSYPQIRKIFGLGTLGGLSDAIIMVIGLILVVVGIVIAFKKSDPHNSAHEVPIFEGEGKNRKIIGYQRMEKK